MGHFDERRERVRSIPIPDYVEKVIVPEMPWYFSDYTVDFEVRPVIKCPLHGEDTPSFRWYSDTNTFYCFGCGKGGDIVSLDIEFRGQSGEKITLADSLDFLESVFAIDGEVAKSPVKNTAKIASKSKVARLNEQSNIELLKFSRVYGEIDKAVIKSDLPFEVRVTLYKCLDDAGRLVKDNLVSATDALEYIREVYRELSDGRGE